jgi:F0F1-type ATP synthase assembly protein I
VEHTHADAALGHALAGAVIGFAVAGFFLSQAYSMYLYTILGMILGFAKLELNAAAPLGQPAPPRTRGFAPRGGHRMAQHSPLVG